MDAEKKRLEKEKEKADDEEEPDDAEDTYLQEQIDEKKKLIDKGKVCVCV